MSNEEIQSADKTDVESNMKPPLNGVLTHPLTPASLSALRDLLRSPQPRQELNPGVANRLEREGLVESVQLPSPYKTHKGRSITHLQVTAAGCARLEADAGKRRNG